MHVCVCVCLAYVVEMLRIHTHIHISYVHTQERKRERERDGAAPTALHSTASAGLAQHQQGKCREPKARTQTLHKMCSALQGARLCTLGQKKYAQACGTLLLLDMSHQSRKNTRNALTHCKVTNYRIACCEHVLESM